MMSLRADRRSRRVSSRSPDRESVSETSDSMVEGRMLVMGWSVVIWDVGAMRR